jgi:protein TonB
MKSLIASLTFLSITNSVCAQFSTDTIFYDKSWKESTKSNAAFYRLYLRETNQKYYVEDYFINGSIQMKGNFSSIYPSRKHGKFSYYDEQGRLVSELDYVANKKDGKSIKYSKDGNIESVEIYAEGNFISRQCYTEMGTLTDCATDIVEIQPEFPGGLPAMYQFIQENVVYPIKAKNKGIQGKVYLQFIVSPDGSILDVKVRKGAHPILNEEAVRVVKMMPKWKPGSQGGTFVSVTYNLPIVFKLN